MENRLYRNFISHNDRFDASPIDPTHMRYWTAGCGTYLGAKVSFQVKFSKGVLLNISFRSVLKQQVVSNSRFYPWARMTIECNRIKPLSFLPKG